MDADLTTDEVAAALRLHRVTVQRWLKSGRLKGYQIGRSWRVPLAAVEELRQLEPLAAHLSPSTSPTGGRSGGYDAYEEWEAALLAEDDLASVAPAPDEALWRESLYTESATF